MADRKAIPRWGDPDGPGYQVHGYVNGPMFRDLEEVRADVGITRTEALRRALALWLYGDEEATDGR